MWGVEPNLSSIKPVGTQLFYSIHHFERIGKLDPWCKKGVLVGFDEEMKSYRIWDSESGKIVRSRDVSFEKADEDTGNIFYDEFKADKAGEALSTKSPTEPTINQGGDKNTLKLWHYKPLLKKTRLFRIVSEKLRSQASGRFGEKLPDN